MSSKKHMKGVWKDLKGIDKEMEEIAKCPLMQHLNDEDEGCMEPESGYAGQYVFSSQAQQQELQQTLPLGKGSKPAERQEYYVDRISENGSLLLTSTGQTCLYQEDLGYYQQITDLDAYIADIVSTDGRAALSVRDIHDIGVRLWWRENIVCSLDDFNSCPAKVNLENGVWDFERAPLLPHSHSYWFAYVIHANCIENSSQISCPEFDRFCETSLDGDPAKRQLLLEFIGYICLDTNVGKCALFLKGQPNSGKSVITALTSRLFDSELITNIPLHQLGDRFFRAELSGKKLNAAGEMARKNLSDASIFKSVTGSDRIAGEFKGEKPFYFIPRCKLLFCGTDNHISLLCINIRRSHYENKTRGRVSPVPDT